MISHLSAHPLSITYHSLILSYPEQRWTSTDNKRGEGHYGSANGWGSGDVHTGETDDCTLPFPHDRLSLRQSDVYNPIPVMDARQDIGEGAYSTYLPPILSFVTDHYASNHFRSASISKILRGRETLRSATYTETGCWHLSGYPVRIRYTAAALTSHIKL